MFNFQKMAELVSSIWQSSNEVHFYFIPQGGSFGQL